MKRVVITGIGVVSSIGNNKQEVTESLKAGRSGITHSDQFEEMQLRSHVWGDIKLNPAELIDRKALRFMGMPQPTPIWLCSKPLKTAV